MLKVTITTPGDFRVREKWKIVFIVRGKFMLPPFQKTKIVIQ